MPEGQEPNSETPTGSGEEPEVQTPPAPSAPSPPAGQPPSPAEGAAPKGPEPEGARTFDEAYVRKLREESAGYRKRAQEAEAKVKAAEEKDLTELQKLQRRVEELETRNRDLEGSLRSADIISEAARAGAVNPAIVAKLVDKDAEDVGQAIAAIKKECPQLFRPPAGSANGGAATGAGSAAPPKEGMNFLIRQAAGRG